jgi:FkbM family methyltransferase
MSGALLPRIERFLSKPWNEKRHVLSWKLKQLWVQSFLGIPVVKRMESGFLFIVWNDAIRQAVLSGQFENAERRFVERFLQPGMVFLDVGAYYGIYALTASNRIGSSGRVIAFEPSPLQFKRLRWNLLLNRCKNVRVENMALGNREGEVEFFAAKGGSEGFSGLRAPRVDALVRSIRVKLATLDNYLQRQAVGTVDFIKVDVEGGELDFFKGAENLLRQMPRPIILCELQDVRAEAWGHQAKDTAAFVKSLGYRWFKPLRGGSLARLQDNVGQYEGNFVGVPEERIAQVEEMIRDGSHAPG